LQGFGRLSFRSVDRLRLCHLATLKLDCSELRRCLWLLGNVTEKAAIGSGLKCHTEAAVIIIADGDEAKRLKARSLIFARGIQHFRHAVDGASAGMESNFDEIARSQLVLQLEQTSIDRNGLKFCARSLTTFRHDCGSDRSVELYALRTAGGVVLGEVSHSDSNMTFHPELGQITKALVQDGSR
jgi:hypothetical protein